jgi:hypothetical protein
MQEKKVFFNENLHFTKKYFANWTILRGYKGNISLIKIFVEKFIQSADPKLFKK